MSNYWAIFEEIGEHKFRYDTRIYLQSVDVALDTDECIGAIVGKNPGSALPKGNVLNELCEIDLGGDKLLPTVKNIVSKGLNISGGRKYIQVLNLFYLCDKDLKKAIEKHNKIKLKKYCSTEHNDFPWVWFLWGGGNPHLTTLKERFRNINTSKMFYLDNKDYENASGAKRIIKLFPENNVCAKHTQGMKHELILPYFRNNL